MYFYVPLSLFVVAVECFFRLFSSSWKTVRWVWHRPNAWFSFFSQFTRCAIFKRERERENKQALEKKNTEEKIPLKANGWLFPRIYSSGCRIYMFHGLTSPSPYSSLRLEQSRSRGDRRATSFIIIIIMACIIIVIDITLILDITPEGERRPSKGGLTVETLTFRRLSWSRSCSVCGPPPAACWAAALASTSCDLSEAAS